MISRGMLAEGCFGLGFNRIFLPVSGSIYSHTNPQLAFSSDLRSLSSRISARSMSTHLEGESAVPEPPESLYETFVGIGHPESEIKPGDISQESSKSSEKRVQLKNKHGETLVGLLHHTGRSKDLVILCHGFRSSKESRTLLYLADALEKQDISVFRFDFSGNGESEGSFQYGNYWKEVDDLRAVIQLFSNQGWRINAIVGHSKGGNAVLLYASIFNDVPKVINISGRFALDKGIEERLGANYIERIKRDGFIDVKDESDNLLYRVTEESLMDRLSTDMRSSCSLINRNCKVFTVHGSEDEVIPVKDASEFGNLISNHELRIIEGANHRYSGHSSELSSCVLEFLRGR